MGAPNSNPTAPVATAPSAPAAATSPTATAQPGYGASTTVTNMTNLKEQAPEVWTAMMQGIAQTIINQMQDAQNRLKALMQQERQDAGG